MSNCKVLRKDFGLKSVLIEKNENKEVRFNKEIKKNKKLKEN